MEAHERSNEVFLKLAERGIITIYDYIDEEMVAHVRDRLAVAEAHNVPEIDVRIQTNGGIMTASLDIHDMIRTAHVGHRKGTVVGYGRSSGVIILQACDRREATRHARLMIHEIRNDDVSLTTLRKLAYLRTLRERLKMIETLEHEQEALDNILMRHAKCDRAKIRRLCAHNTDMSAEEALVFGLIDAIRD